MITPVKGRLSSAYGDRIHPVTGKKTFHNGVDIAAPMGAPVLAPDSGTITEIWYHPTGGKSLAMITPDGFRFGFCHLSDRLVKVNQKVNQGDIIAKVGSTGASTGPHLHFTVKKNGMLLNPQIYFKL